MPALSAILDACIFGNYSWVLNGAKGLGYVGMASATGAAKTLIDNQFVDTGADITSWIGYWLQRPTAANAADVYRRVTAFTNTTGTFTHGGADYVANAVATDPYRLSYLDPHVIMNCINDGLNDCVSPYWVLCSLVVDGDMESSVTTVWTATTATLSKQTGSVNVFSGVRSLRVANSALNGQAASTAIYSYPGTSYLVAAIVRGANYTPVLLALDASSATIDSVTGVNTTNDWQVIWFTVTTPNTSAGRSMSFILRGSEVGAILEWDCLFVIALSQQRVTLPSWMEYANDISDIITMDYRGSSLSSDVFRADGGQEQSLSNFKLLPEGMRLSLSTVGRSMQALINPGYIGNGMLYAVGNRRGASLGTIETATTHIPLELAVAAAYRRYCEGKAEYNLANARFKTAQRFYLQRTPIRVQHPMIGV